jgi:hypothetical protein
VCVREMVRVHFDRKAIIRYGCATENKVDCDIGGDRSSSVMWLLGVLAGVASGTLLLLLCCLLCYRYTFCHSYLCRYIVYNHFVTYVTTSTPCHLASLQVCRINPLYYLHHKS